MQITLTPDLLAILSYYYDEMDQPLLLQDVLKKRYLALMRQSDWQATEATVDKVVESLMAWGESKEELKPTDVSIFEDCRRKAGKNFPGQAERLAVYVKERKERKSL